MAKKIKFFAEIKSPPFENEARLKIGEVLRSFQEGEIPGEPIVKLVLARAACVHTSLRKRN
jgi:hypothetical protein